MTDKKYFSDDDRLRRQYELKEMAERDYISELNLARREGIRIGIQKVIQEGKYEEKRNNAINLLKLGVVPDLISKGLELSIEKVLSLKENL